MSERVIETTGRPLTTLKHTCGDTAETLIDDVTSFVAQVTTAPTAHPVSENVVACLITCETNDIRFTWTSTPTQDSGTAVGHVLAAGQSLKLTNHKQVIGFTFINKVNGSNAVLQITGETSRV